MSENHCGFDPQTCPVAQEVKRLSNEVEDMKNKQTQYAITSAVRDEQYKNILSRLDGISTSVEKITNKVEAIEEKPAKRWDDVVRQVIVVVIAGVVGMILAKMGIAG